MAPKAFMDLADLPEDDRIQLIGQRARTGERVLFFVDDEDKADRYLKKLQEQFPDIVCVARFKGPSDTVGVTVSKRPN